MRPAVTRGALAVSGAILAITGASIMAAPRLFLVTSEVIIEHDAGLLSEVTAPSGLLVVTGVFMMVSAIRARLARLGLLAGALVYGSYAMSRFISMNLHGTPSDTLVIVAYFELGVAGFLSALNLASGSSGPEN